MKIARLLSMLPLATLLSACGQVGSGQTATSATSPVSSVTEASHNRTGSPIVARISLSRTQAERESDIEVVTIIENRGEEPLVFSEEEFTSPNVLLEVRDAMGDRLLSAPPPVPTGRKRTVDRGKQVEIRMTMAGMFSPPLKPGAYNVRLRRVSTTPHAFRITGP